MLVLGDVLPPNVSAFTDAMALIRFAAANGFLAAALVGLCRTALSDYWRLRSSLGLTRYGEAAMVKKLTRRRVFGKPRRRQYRPQPCRMTFLARPMVDSSTSGYRIANDRSPSALPETSCGQGCGRYWRPRGGRKPGGGELSTIAASP